MTLRGWQSQTSRLFDLIVCLLEGLLQVEAHDDRILSSLRIDAEGLGLRFELLEELAGLLQVRVRVAIGDWLIAGGQSPRRIAG